MSDFPRKQVDDIGDQINELQDRREQVIQAWATETAKFKVGDVVSYPHGYKGARRKLKITSIAGTSGAAIRYRGISIRKDGTEGSPYEASSHMDLQLEEQSE
jgi:hypothetical protein